MSKQLGRGVLIAVLAIFAVGTMSSCGEVGMESCPHCGKSFPISNVRFHVRKCPKNNTNQRMDKPVSGKTTTID